MERPRTWDGSRPRVCDDSYCAASDEWWQPRMAPRRYVGLAESVEPEHGWSSSHEIILDLNHDFTKRTVWYFCETCHEMMNMELLLLRQLRENRIIDAPSQVSES